MWVTIYTDASHHPGHRVAGWAAWIRSEKGRVVRKGRCPSYVQNSDQAELAAAFAGIYLSLVTWRGSVTGVLICSDSQNALAHIEGKRNPSKNPFTRRLTDKIHELVSQHGLYVRCKWVRGHQSRTRGVSAWLNNECDRLAKLGRNDQPPGHSARTRVILSQAGPAK